MHVPPAVSCADVPPALEDREEVARASAEVVVVLGGRERADDVCQEGGGVRQLDGRCEERI